MANNATTVKVACREIYRMKQLELPCCAPYVTCHITPCVRTMAFDTSITRLVEGGVRHLVREIAQRMSQFIERRLMQDCKSNITVMYLHDGPYVFISPVSAFPSTIPLSTLTTGRCFALEYRMGPQAQALSQQLSSFIGYLSLLDPLPSEYNKPVPASLMLVAGDNYSASKCFLILQIVLQPRRQQYAVSSMIRFFNAQTVYVPMLAGVTGLSFICDAVLRLSSYSRQRYR